MALAVCALVPPCVGAVSANAARRQPPKPTPAQMKHVVREWSAYLNAGDDAGEARLFALPATMIQGPYVYRLVSRAQVAAWHSGLPCSGRIVSIAVHGLHADAVFRLGNRVSSKCDAPGTLAAARFTFAGGKIAIWQQIPPPPSGGSVA
jgi:hypothetical protein